MKILMMMMMIHLLCFLQSSFFTFAILDPIDFLSLQLIRSSLTDSYGSNYFSSWDFTIDPCNFPGVYCDPDKIIALNLGDPSAGSPGLTDRLHPAIENLSSLAEFTIVPGRIIGTATGMSDRGSGLKVKHSVSHEGCLTCGSDIM